MTKIINTEQLMDELEDLYDRAGWEDHEIHFSLADIRANIDGVAPATFRGYNISDLSFAAGLLIGQGISPEKLRGLVGDFSLVAEMVDELVKREFDRAVTEALRRGDDG